ncbi:MAG: hypothetical protein JW934_21215 [Anaerolineae bacterium]|nr:hypothetical protein [Anaerolineae bacterium]
MLILVEIAGQRVWVYRSMDRVWVRQAFVVETLSVVLVDGDLPQPGAIAPSDLERAAAWIGHNSGQPLPAERLASALESYRLTMGDYAAYRFTLTEAMCRRWFRFWPVEISLDYWQIPVASEGEKAWVQPMFAW